MEKSKTLALVCTAIAVVLLCAGCADKPEGSVQKSAEKILSVNETQFETTPVDGHEMGRYDHGKNLTYFMERPLRTSEVWEVQVKGPVRPDQLPATIHCQTGNLTIRLDSLEWKPGGEFTIPGSVVGKDHGVYEVVISAKLRDGDHLSNNGNGYFRHDDNQRFDIKGDVGGYKDPEQIELYIQYVSHPQAE